MDRGRVDGAVRSVRIFLAEDNDDLALLISRQLRTQDGWRVTRGRSVADSVGPLRGDRFDVVVLDYRLPDGDGLDLLRVVRESAPETPVLFLTAHGSEDVAMRALAMGAAEYMQKTSGVAHEIVPRIEALLDRAPDLAEASRVAIRIVRDEDHRVTIAADATLDAFVQGDVRGAAIFDAEGKIVSAILPKGLDAATFGTTLARLDVEIASLGAETGLLPTGAMTLLHVDGAVGAVGRGPNGTLLAVFVDPEEGEIGAVARLKQLARLA